MPEIRRLVVKFFTFVDVNGDHAVEIRELDDARAYLGLPPLSDKDHESLAALCNENEELEFEVIVNFVSIVRMLSFSTCYSCAHHLDRTNRSPSSNSKQS